MLRLPAAEGIRVDRERRTVDVHAARLRRRLGARYRARIVTVRRVGCKYTP
ncbi:hypothetical protein DTL70_09540 [Streptomyces diacarni]|uniref:OmpR/PhoB-type domain-containing protein n=1 Tax=Streptomyces diacarni TaxID=2800381 RepID=A0A367F5G9_9ACTN|nr:hypothetical protein DTL70_09540 [Streptomyces diacarni]